MGNYSNLIFRVIPIGGVVPIPFDFVSTDEIGQMFLRCEGTEHLIDDYLKLHGVIGDTYGETDGAGGAGTTHFKVPDLRGVFLQHTDGTVSTGTFADSTMINHHHYISNISNDKWVQHPGDPWSIHSLKGYAGTPSGKYNFTGKYVGGSETRPKNVYVNYCIRYI